MKNLLVLSILLLFFAGCTLQSVDQKAEAEKLMQLSREWAQVASSNDVEKTVDFWSEDAVVMMPDQAAFKGHEAIRQMVEGSFEIPGFEINWEPQEAFVSKSGDLGYVLAHNYIKMLDSLGNTITLYNKGVEIWEKMDDGSWKCVADIFNEDPTLTSIK